MSIVKNTYSWASRHSAFCLLREIQFLRSNATLRDSILFSWRFPCVVWHNKNQQTLVFLPFGASPRWFSSRFTFLISNFLCPISCSLIKNWMCNCGSSLFFPNSFKLIYVMSNFNPLRLSFLCVLCFLLVGSTADNPCLSHTLFCILEMRNLFVVLYEFQC